MELPNECLYCGRPATRPKRGLGEHIIPGAIGGKPTLLDTSGHLVCDKCNNGPLSHADEELCGRSHLSLVASQELDARLWQAWDIDHNSENLLIEARPRWNDGELQHLVPYPQIVFEKSGPQIRGDAEELESFGREKYARVLLEGVRRTLEAFNKGRRRGLKYEEVMSSAAREENRYAPRIYAPLLKTIPPLMQHLEVLFHRVCESYLIQALAGTPRLISLSLVPKALGQFMWWQIRQPEYGNSLC